MRLVASRPSMIGISTSITTTSGSVSSTFSTASAPLQADPITSMPGLESRTRRMTLRIASESSTIRARNVVSLSWRKVVSRLQCDRIGSSYRTEYYEPVTINGGIVTPVLQIPSETWPKQKSPGLVRLDPRIYVHEQRATLFLRRGMGDTRYGLTDKPVTYPRLGQYDGRPGIVEFDLAAQSENIGA